jgi:hypothetical protein
LISFGARSSVCTGVSDSHGAFFIAAYSSLLRLPILFCCNAAYR